MYINCIACGHKFDVGKSYDDYEGLVRCPTRRALLDVKTQDGSVRSVRFGNIPMAGFAGAAPANASGVGVRDDGQPGQERRAA